MGTTLESAHLQASARWRQGIRRTSSATSRRIAVTFRASSPGTASLMNTRKPETSPPSRGRCVSRGLAAEQYARSTVITCAMLACEAGWVPPDLCRCERVCQRCKDNLQAAFPAMPGDQSSRKSATRRARWRASLQEPSLQGGGPQRSQHCQQGAGRRAALAPAGADAAEEWRVPGQPAHHRRAGTAEQGAPAGSAGWLTPRSGRPGTHRGRDRLPGSPTGAAALVRAGSPGAPPPLECIRSPAQPKSLSHRSLQLLKGGNVQRKARRCRQRMPLACADKQY